MLRIAGGEFRGMALVTPPKIRATETKVRQALFNVLGSAVEGARVLDDRYFMMVKHVSGTEGETRNSVETVCFFLK